MPIACRALVDYQYAGDRHGCLTYRVLLVQRRGTALQRFNRRHPPLFATLVSEALQFTQTDRFPSDLMCEQVSAVRAEPQDLLGGCAKAIVKFLCRWPEGGGGVCRPNQFRNLPATSTMVARSLAARQD